MRCARRGSTCKAQRRSIDSARASVASAEAGHHVWPLRVNAGKSILVEQLDALQSLTRARADLAQALCDHRIAVARIVSVRRADRRSTRLNQEPPNEYPLKYLAIVTVLGPSSDAAADNSPRTVRPRPLRP